MTDFRSQKMPSPDGQGIARSRWARAWDAYVKAVRPVSVSLVKPMTPLIQVVARGATFDLVGFWFVWHTCGGFEGLQSQLGMSRSAIYRRVSMFRRVFGEHPDVFRFPGVEIDLDAFLAASSKPEPTETP